jgi:NADPH2:quinone reductase
MKAIQVAEFGGPDVLKLNEVPTPKPEAGQVLIKVYAVGVNPYDTYMRTGTYAIKPPLPYTPGSDAAGVVEAVGAGVKSVKPGDRVYTAKTVTGAYAEYTIALQAQAQKLPPNVSFEQGAAVWVPYGTAYHAIVHEAKTRAAETVLVHGASGGVGSASVQLLHAMGCTVFGTASSDAGLDLIQRAGATQVFNHSKAGYTDEILKASGGRGVDVILEMLANINLGHDLKLLAQYGRVIVIGNRGDVTINARDLMARRASVRGFTLWAATEAETADIHAGLYAGMENGSLKPVVGKKIPLAEAARAHQEVLQPGASGKIVLIP